MHSAKPLPQSISITESSSQEQHSVKMSYLGHSDNCKKTKHEWIINSLCQGDADSHSNSYGEF